MGVLALGVVALDEAAPRELAQQRAPRRRVAAEAQAHGREAERLPPRRGLGERGDELRECGDADVGRRPDEGVLGELELDARPRRAPGAAAAAAADRGRERDDALGADVVAAEVQRRQARLEEGPGDGDAARRRQAAVGQAQAQQRGRARPVDDGPRELRAAAGAEAARLDAEDARDAAVLGDAPRELVRGHVAAERDGQRRRRCVCCLFGWFWCGCRGLGDDLCWWW